MRQSDGILYLLIALALAAVLILSTSGCAPTPKSDDYREMERLEVVEKSSAVTIYRDTETGVLYMSVYRGGVTPLYNADGTLCTE